MDKVNNKEGWKEYKRYSFKEGYLDITIKDSKNKIFCRLNNTLKWFILNEEDFNTIDSEYKSISYVFTAKEIFEMYVNQ